MLSKPVVVACPPTSDDRSREANAVMVATRTQAEEARRVLGECVLFRDLDPEERNILFAHVRVRSYAAGETIFLMESAADSLMAVVSGSVRIGVPSPDGKEIVLALIQPMEVFGEIALLDGKKRTADAKAIGACTVAVFERHDVLAFLKDNPKVWPKLVEVLCARLRSADQHIAEIAFQELPTRLAKKLLRLASAQGVETTVECCRFNFRSASSATSAAQAARASTSVPADGSAAASSRSRKASSR